MTPLGADMARIERIRKEQGDEAADEVLRRYNEVAAAQAKWLWPINLILFGFALGLWLGAML